MPHDIKSRQCLVPQRSVKSNAAVFRSEKAFFQKKSKKKSQENPKQSFAVNRSSSRCHLEDRTRRSSNCSAKTNCERRRLDPSLRCVNASGPAPRARPRNAPGFVRRPGYVRRPAAAERLEQADGRQAPG